MTPPDLSALAEGLTEAQRRFLTNVCTGSPLPLADRAEDRVRQSCRRMELVEVAKNPRRWVATILGEQVRAHLTKEKNDADQ